MFSYGKATLIIVLLIISIASTFYQLPTANADVTATLTFSATTSDGYQGRDSTTYSTAHDATTGGVYDTTTELGIGQYYSAPTYYVYRGFVYFDTSALPDIASIDNAILGLCVDVDSSASDFNVTVQNGQPTYPHDPLQNGDYYYSHYSGDGGSANTSTISGLGYWNVTLSATGLGWISKTGTTKLMLISSEDIGNSAPTGWEGIWVFSSEQGASYAPKLYVTYTVPDTTAPTYSVVGHSTVLAGASCNFYAYFDDNVALDYYIFSTNNTGTWTNETATAFTTTPSWGNVTKTLNSTVGTIVQYRWYWNDTAGNWGSMSIQSLTTESIPDYTAPTYSVIGHTTILAGTSCVFYGYFNDNVALSYYIFSTNNTGTWVNETATAFSATPDWGNVTKTLNASAGMTVQYRWYWNDTSNNWGTMTTQSLVTSATEYTVTVSSFPEINAAFTLNGTTYTTTEILPLASGTYTFEAITGKVYGGTAYEFDYWIANGTIQYEDISISLSITGTTSLTAHYAEISNIFSFYGPFDEETGYALDENVSVTAYHTGGIAPYNFTLNGYWAYPLSTSVQYFLFTFNDSTTREYWVDPSEGITDIYVFKGNTTEYTINFLDTSGILDTYPYVTAKRYINGTLYTVEKRKVDAYNSVLMSLVYGRTYQIVLGNEATTYVFGDLLMTGQTYVQLTLRGVDFPKETLLLQKYIRVYAYRNTTDIIIVYQDTLNLTTSVLIEVNYANFANAYNTTVTTSNFMVDWASADEDTTYQITVTVTHQTYGTLTYKQIIAGSMGVAAPPFSLSFLGNWGFDSSTLIPAFIILFVAGCFSALNAEVGAVLMCVAAIILTAMGWISIPIGSIVAATTLAVLMALIYHKRRGGIG